MRIGEALVQKMAAHVRAGYPHEACGVFLGRNEAGRIEVKDVVPVTNRETELPGCATRSPPRT